MGFNFYCKNMLCNCLYSTLENGPSSREIEVRSTKRGGSRYLEPKIRISEYAEDDWTKAAQPRRWSAARMK
jgi:hypothetical protein